MRILKKRTISKNKITRRKFAKKNFRRSAFALFKRRFRGRVKAFRAARKDLRREKYKAIASPRLLRTERSVSILKKKQLTFFNLIASQLLVYSRSKVSSTKDVFSFFRNAKKSNNKISPVIYMQKFLKKAMPRLFLREYRVGPTKLRVPVPANYFKNRLAFIKLLVRELRNRSEKGFADKISGEIFDFANKRGYMYDSKIKAYEDAKENSNYTRYAYKMKSYTKRNVNKKSKFSII